MTTTAASGQAEQQGRRGRVMSWLSKVFQVNPRGLNWPAGVMLLDVLLVVWIVSLAVGEERYLLSAVVGVLFTAVADPGGAYGSRASHNAGFVLIGALVTALAFALGGSGWGWLVLAAFAITLVAGLAIRFGVHRFAAATFLNLWFIIALGQAVSLHHQTHVTSHTWAQVVAWVAGSAVWIAVTFIAWLVRGRKDWSKLFQEIPGDTSPRKLTPPLIMFALIRALAIAAAAALAFGLDLSHGDWMPIAALLAMKPALDQTTLAAAQRVVGALIGAAAAALLLLIPANEHGEKLNTLNHGLEVVAIVLMMHAIASRFWSYALFYAALTAAILILLDVPHPSNYSAEGDRVLWTLAGVGIGVIATLLAGLLAKRKNKAQPQPTQPQPA